ncbi:unnamed protein product [Darwinula stevensoni]|uniref:Large ribosomal subunit protein uL29m n=1 Tax=Darwinula stevensoni TaxID=69355 RepID=A0A7R9A9K2_9CRUS|nr:unnamed protein product [Darwinula stevensoni]CAG0897441.1 unnamed protein product [Darwinula stevensoni]
MLSAVRSLSLPIARQVLPTLSTLAKRLSSDQAPKDEKHKDEKTEDQKPKLDPRLKGLMEFFDEPRHWGASEVRVGRAWRAEELRIKSNSDLHKLWFVLLKERNMLLSMEHESKQEFRLFPNPERLDKVEQSMENLEVVVRERNRAYHLLETGESGERPGMWVTDWLGRVIFYRKLEHVHPPRVLPYPSINRKFRYRKDYGFTQFNPDVEAFLKLYREKRLKKYLARMRRQRSAVLRLLEKFPKVDPEALQKEFPLLDIPWIIQLREERLKVTRQIS